MTAEPDVKQGQLDPTAIGPADLARLLSAAAGVRIDDDGILDDIDTGAPTNAEGTMNLVHYAAWLVRQLAEHGGRGRGSG